MSGEKGAAPGEGMVRKGVEEVKRRELLLDFFSLGREGGVSTLRPRGKDV